MGYHTTKLSRAESSENIAATGLGDTVKPVLSGHSKGGPKTVFQDQLLLNAGQKYCRMLQESILQYFQPSVSYVPFIFKTFVLSILEWMLNTGFTVTVENNIHRSR